ncbi:hypothetical protein [Streptomyces rimosus]|uniref:hypothetical protein n=1 Tax=Streptomyces rimosus TaxID=1927 RepID=UPI000ABA06F3|nr:hypothetical protein [Streptomyces rimosus]
MILTILWFLDALLAINAIACFVSAWMARSDCRHMQEIFDELVKRRDSPEKP